MVSGGIGPRSDGYVVTNKMDIDTAKAYHALQIEAFSQAGADMATALTLNYIDEGLGIAAAARTVGLPIALSFTVKPMKNWMRGKSQHLKITDFRVSEQRENRAKCCGNRYYINYDNKKFSQTWELHRLLNNANHYFIIYLKFFKWLILPLRTILPPLPKTSVKNQMICRRIRRAVPRHTNTDCSF